jgi:hypothetical protein
MTSELGLPHLWRPLTADRRQLLSRRIQLFVAATITYNVIEAVIALTEGTRVSSTALVGFGLDAVIEVSSAAAVAWQFAGKDPEAREKIALRIIAFSFFGLALYVTIDAIRSLFGFGEAQQSIVGITLAAVSLVIMPVLSWSSAVPVANWAHCRRSPTPNRLCCARICRRCCWWDCCSTVSLDGPGRIRSQPWSSP